jgi:L-malate glycosyltransferase
LVNLVEELEQKKIRTYVIFRKGEDNKNYKANGSKVIFILKTFFELLKFRDSTIASQAYWYCLFPAIFYKFFFRCKVIFTFRSEPEQKLNYLSKFFFQFLISHCDCITFVSKGLKDIIDETYHFTYPCVSIIYPGVKQRSITKTERDQFIRAYDIRPESIVILVQAFTATKFKAEGLRLVIKSVKILQRKYPNLILIATRDGAFSQELKKFSIEERMEKSVIFTGDIENPFLPLELCDIFIFPWLGKSGVGNSLLEAMSMGKPIIVTSVDGGGVTEIIKDRKTGIVASPECLSIAEKIELLLQNDHLRYEIGKNAKDEVEKNFTWEKCANQFIELATR